VRWARSAAGEGEGGERVADALRAALAPVDGAAGLLYAAPPAPVGEGDGVVVQLILRGLHFERPDDGTIPGQFLNAAGGAIAAEDAASRLVRVAKQVAVGQEVGRGLPTGAGPGLDDLACGVDQVGRAAE
jgi:hypothetical protein